jgi:hypothetical protein
MYIFAGKKSTKMVFNAQRKYTNKYTLQIFFMFFHQNAQVLCYSNRSGCCNTSQLKAKLKTKTKITN